METAALTTPSPQPKIVYRSTMRASLFEIKSANDVVAAAPGGGLMQDFILKQNIKRYTGILKAETDPERRRVIQGLLQKAVGDLQALERAGIVRGAKPTGA